MADELTEQLKRWGHATVARFAANDDGPSAGDHILARQRDLALKSKRKREDEYRPVGRDGSDRRRFMAARSGVRGMTITPTWAVDPVRSRNDADHPHDRPVVRVDIGIPDELRWIDRAVSQLARAHPIRALVLREEYCGVGTQERKAAAVQHAYGGRVTVRQYRDQLRLAREWLRGRMAA